MEKLKMVRKGHKSSRMQDLRDNFINIHIKCKNYWSDRTKIIKVTRPNICFRLKAFKQSKSKVVWIGK